MYAPTYRSQRPVRAPSAWVPPIQPEETFYSYAYRLLRLACIPPAKELIHTLFGTGHRYLDQLVLEKEHGPDTLEKCLRPLGIQSDQGMLLEHSLRALALPFRPRRQPRDGFSFRPSSNHYSNEHGMRATGVRTSPAFCPACTARDFDQLGFSYWRRSLQITGVNFCPEHREGIIDRCITCGDPTGLSQLPDTKCKSCQSPMTSLYAYKGSTQDRVMLGYASAVEQVFLGGVAGPLDAAALLDHFDRVRPKTNPITGADLCTYVEAVAGKDYLSELNLAYAPQDKFPWPTLFYANGLVIGEAAHQLLIYAAVTSEHANENLFLTNCPESDAVVVTDNLHAGFDILWAELQNASRRA